MIGLFIAFIETSGITLLQQQKVYTEVLDSQCVLSSRFSMVLLAKNHQGGVCFQTQASKLQYFLYRQKEVKSLVIISLQTYTGADH